MKRKIVSVILSVCLLLSLCACGGKEETTAGGYAKEIYLYNWSEYMTQEVLDKFEAEYGIKVVQSTYESNDELLAKLVADSSGGEYDIAVPTNYYISAMLENDLLAEIDKDALTNYKNLDEAYLNLPYDEENTYSIPYMGTVSVWIGNKKLLEELGVEVNSMEDLKNPKLKGNIIMTDDSQEVMQEGLIGAGFDPTSTDLDELEKAKEFLMELNENIKSYSTTVDVRDAMAKGEAAVASMYSGEALQALEENPDLEVVMVKEQCSLSLDSFVLLKNSKHKEEAQLFIDFCLRPDISAELTNEYKFVCFNKEAVSNLDEALAANPLCVLTQDMKARTYCINEVNSELLSAEVDAMTEIKSSR